MKWFKHISDSLDDPFIFDLIEKHDANGYLVFFGIIEIYAREFSTEIGWKLEVTLSYLRRKLNRTRNKLITNVLETLKNSGKWDIKIKGDDVSIFIPKFRELLDESTIKKLREKEKSFRNCSGTFPKSEGTDVDREVDVDRDKENKLSFNNQGEDQKGNDGHLKKEIQEALAAVITKYPRFPHANVMGMAFSKNKHPQAILYALQETLKDCKGFSPERYFETILNRTSGNYYEADHISKSKALKESTPTIREALKGAVTNAMSREMQELPEDSES